MCNKAAVHHGEMHRRSSSAEKTIRLGKVMIDDANAISRNVTRRSCRYSLI
jgi:hypothetical protein